MHARTDIMQVVTGTLSRDDACRRSMSAGKLHLQRWDRKDKCRTVAFECRPPQNLVSPRSHNSKTYDPKTHSSFKQGRTSPDPKYIKKPNSSIKPSLSLFIQYNLLSLQFSWMRCSLSNPLNRLPVHPTPSHVCTCTYI